MALSRSLGLFHRLGGFLRDRRGATAVEYGILAGAIALVVIGALTLVFKNIGGVFNFIGASL